MSQIVFDNEGFLINLEDWNRPVAEMIAKNENILLTNTHWELIYLTRAFHKEFGLSPSMRPLIKYAQKKIISEQANSIYFLNLFPGSPAKLLSKIAGLPKPNNCI